MTTWTQRHRQWLGRQRFAEAATELPYLDALAAVDGLVARKQALDERLSRLAVEGEGSARISVYLTGSSDGVVTIAA